MAKRDERSWRLALVGLAISAFSLVALAGPGRIEIVDGVTRYEVSRSLVEHGDPAIRDPDVWFAVYPGRDGKLYSIYRLPQSVAGVPAILAADATGPTSEDRRQFFFALIGAAACALLALCYSVWFRHHGLTPGQALLWAVGGIVCTPNWFYGASTFDDILGAATVVLAVTVALVARKRPRALVGAVAAGLALGFALNCKQPLVVFLLPVLAAIHDPGRSMREQTGRYGLVVAGLAAGLAAYVGYRLYCFPPGTMEANAALTARYGEVWSAKPLPALMALLFSTGTSVLLYCPPLVLSVFGVRSWWRSDRWFCAALLIAAGSYTFVIASLSFFKGDPAWGPRYLTPMFALLWLMAPVGARLMRRRYRAALLTAGVVVQVLALTVDPSRLFIQRGLPVTAGRTDPAFYFDPTVSHLLNRPREILEIASRARAPTRNLSFSFPAIDSLGQGPGAVRGQRTVRLPDTFRPWWASRQQPAVDPLKTALLLIGLLALGSWLQIRGIRRPPKVEAGRSTAPERFA